METLTNPVCPQCASTQVWKDGLRYARSNGAIQRFLCRNCGYRFSQPNVKVNVIPQIGETLDSGKDNHEKRIVSGSCSVKEVSDNGSFFFGEDVASHNLTVIEKGLYALPYYNSKHRVCAISRGAKNLDSATETKTVAGEIEGKAAQDTKGCLTLYAAKQLTMGLTEETIKRRFQLLEQLSKFGADLFNPTSTWKTINNASWADGSKTLAAQAYLKFCKIMRIAISEDLNFRKWKTQIKIPWIPLETEIDQLIAGCRLRMGAFLQLLKETGCRSGEAWRLTWKHFDAEHGVITINNPEKNGLPRQHKISSKLVAMLNSLPKTNQKIWNGNIHSWRSSFVGQRNRIAAKLQNPRLRDIHFHTLRHFYATMLYHKTLNLLEVQQKLGHRNINNTVIYTHLVNFDSNEYLHAHAKTLEEEDALLDAGYEFVRYSEKDQVAVYRKRK